MPRRPPATPPLGASAVARTLAIAGLLGASAAAAEPGVALTPRLAPAGDAAFLVSAPDARGAGLARFRVAADHAERPLVLIDADQQSHAIVRRQTTLWFGLSLAWAHRVLVYADLPLVIDAEGVSAASTGAVAPDAAQALGDLRAGGRMRWLGPAGDAFQLGSGLELSAPTGSEAAYAGDGALGARLYTAMGARTRELAWSAELGFLRRESERFGGVLPTRVGSALELGGMLQVALDTGARVLLGPELALRTGVADGAKPFDPRSTLLHVLIALRARPLGNAFEARLALGPDLAQAAGSADYRALLELGWAPEVPAPPPDRDADGVPDASDVCLRLPGVASADPLMNGCPELPLDSDGDSVPDAFDGCPREPGEATRDRRTHGCPRRTEPPAPPPAAALVEQQIVISEQVRFETNTAVIRPESDAILSEVARVLREHPELTLIEVQGHTDDTGGAELNQRLSRERAEAVMAWLVARGVDAGRLQARGYGADRPISDNASEEGRAKNRRVEFRVLAGPGAKGGGP